MQETDNDDFMSISKAFKPDYLLSVKKHGVEKIVILDAKYRASREAIQEGLRELHVYRDAIRKRSSLKGVDGAYIITPNYAAEVKTYFDQAYRDKYRFGAFVLSLDGKSQKEELKTELAKILSLS